MRNLKSDVDAKVAFAEELRRRGYEPVAITRAPADITARRNGKSYYFEVKYTRQKARYFGAATLTEWRAAIENEECFRFVVCSKKLGQWMFKEYTPTEFMQFSCIPPFKVYFNVAIGGTKTPPSGRISKSIGLTRERLRLMLQLYGHLRNGEATSSAPRAASIGLTRQKRPTGSRDATLPEPFIEKHPSMALLSGRHYVRRASAENYWFDFARSKVLSLQRRHGDNFCLVIDGESQGKYVIPFAAAKRYFTDQTLDRRRNRWVGTIVGGRLNLGSAGTSFAVEEYRNRFELL